MPRYACVLLSGGVYSTVAACWAKQRFEKIQTFTVKCCSTNCADSAAAFRISNFLQTDKHEVFELSSLLFEAESESSPPFAPCDLFVYLGLAINRGVFRGIHDYVIGGGSQPFRNNQHFQNVLQSFAMSCQSALSKCFGDFSIRIHAPVSNLLHSELVTWCLSVPQAYRALALCPSDILDEVFCGKTIPNPGIVRDWLDNRGELPSSSVYDVFRKNKVEKFADAEELLRSTKI